MGALDASWSFLKAKPLRDQPGWNRERREIARRKELARERDAMTAETQPTTLNQFTPPDVPVDPMTTAEARAKVSTRTGTKDALPEDAVRWDPAKVAEIEARNKKVGGG